METHDLSLLSLLSNRIILHQIAPYVGIRDLLRLAAASKTLRRLILLAPDTFYHVDFKPFVLDPARCADLSPFIAPDPESDKRFERFRNCYFGLHNICPTFLQNVRVLILDGHPVPIPIISALLLDQNYSVRILSMIDNVAFNITEFVRLIRYMIRPSRPHGQPKLKAIYTALALTSSKYHGRSHEDEVSLRTGQMLGVTNTIGAQLGTLQSEHAKQPAKHIDDFYGYPWYSVAGQVPGLKHWPGFPNLVEACADIISFDAILCRHDRDRIGDPAPYLAEVILGGCQNCGSCPERPAKAGLSPESHLPLLSPPPLHTYSVSVAQSPVGREPARHVPELIARCRLCLSGRWCEACNAWWCEDCYSTPRNSHPIEEKSQDFAKLEFPMASSIKVHNGLCVQNCLMGDLLQRGGEGGMWG